MEGPFRVNPRMMGLKAVETIYCISGWMISSKEYEKHILKVTLVDSLLLIAVILRNA